MARGASRSERQLSLALLLFAANQRLGRLIERELAADGVNADDYALLSLVGARGPVRLTEAAAELGLRLTTASDAIRRLETRGHVDRLPNPDDGRSWLFQLSSEGDRAWRRGWHALRRVHEGVLERLDDPDTVRLALEQIEEATNRALMET